MTTLAHPGGPIRRNAPPASSRRSWTWRLLACALILAPLAVIEIPPLGDYPNHLARAMILGALDHDATFARFFAWNLRPMPNLAMDVFMLAVGAVTGPYIAGRLFLGVVLLATVWGVRALNRAVFGEASPWTWVAAFFVFNQVFLAGFLNYALGLALALGFAGLLEARRGAPAALRVALAAALALAVYFVHLLAYGLFVVLVGALELHAAAHARGVPVRARLARLIGTAAALSPPLLLMLATTDYAATTPPSADSPAPALPIDLARRSIEMLRMLQSGFEPGAGFLGLAFVGLTALAALWRQRLGISPPLLAIAAAALLAALFAPGQGTFHVDLLHQRFPIMVALLVVAGTSPRLAALNRPLWLLPAFLLLALQSGSVARDFLAWRAELREFRAAFATIPAGSMVFSIKPDALPGDIARTAPNRHFYYGALLGLHQLQLAMAAERRLFMPYNFAHPQKQLLQVREQYRAFAFADGGVATPWALARQAHLEPDVALPVLNQPIWQPTRAWSRRYEYVTVLYPDLVEGWPTDDPSFERRFHGRWIAVHAIHADRPAVKDRDRP
jgi:hypothetical protein